MNFDDWLHAEHTAFLSFYSSIFPSHLAPSSLADLSLQVRGNLYLLINIACLLLPIDDYLDARIALDFTHLPLGCIIHNQEGELHLSRVTWLKPSD